MDFVNDIVTKLFQTGINEAKVDLTFNPKDFGRFLYDIQPFWKYEHGLNQISVYNELPSFEHPYASPLANKVYWPTANCIQMKFYGIVVTVKSESIPNFH